MKGKRKQHCCLQGMVNLMRMKHDYFIPSHFFCFSTGQCSGGLDKPAISVFSLPLKLFDMGLATLPPEGLKKLYVYLISTTALLQLFLRELACVTKTSCIKRQPCSFLFPQSGSNCCTIRNRPRTIFSTK